MRVAQLIDGRLKVLDNEPWPAPKQGEVLVKVWATGCTPPGTQVRRTGDVAATLLQRYLVFWWPLQKGGVKGEGEKQRKRDKKKRVSLFSPASVRVRRFGKTMTSAREEGTLSRERRLAQGEVKGKKPAETD